MGLKRGGRCMDAMVISARIVNRLEAPGFGLTWINHAQRGKTGQGGVRTLIKAWRGPNSRHKGQHKQKGD